jgi:predicted  nucleic acid-binding Zn-ribbon protein
MRGRFPSEYQEWTSTINENLADLERQVRDLGRRLDASALAHAALLEKLENLERLLTALERRLAVLEGRAG